MREFIIGLPESAESPGVTEAKLETSRRDSEAPQEGQSAGSSADSIERMRSNISAQSPHLYS
jgi:hypothetical protein